MMNTLPVVNTFPNTSGIEAIHELMEATIEARDVDPPRQRAAPVHDLHRPFVIAVKIPGDNDHNRQNLGVWDLRPHITAMPQSLHQRVNHGESGYYAASDCRLLLAAMFGLTTAIVPEVSVSVN